jgi:hypothetical protein
MKGNIRYNTRRTRRKESQKSKEGSEARKVLHLKTKKMKIKIRTLNKKSKPKSRPEIIRVIRKT